MSTVYVTSRITLSEAVEGRPGLNSRMSIPISDRRDLAAEHACYLDRIALIIRTRLTSRGASQAKIAAYIAELPAEHFMVHIRIAIAAIQLNKSLTASRACKLNGNASFTVTRAGCSNTELLLGSQLNTRPILTF